MLSDFAIFNKRETKDKKSIIWYSMGPFLLLLTLSIVLIYSEKIPLSIILACAGGIIFSSLFQIYGALLASGLILYLQFPQLQEFTVLLTTASILLSFLIMALSSLELRKLASPIDVKALPLSLEQPLQMETVKEDRDVEHQYKQLRKQFEEKSSILNQTRRQLFETENALMAKEREILELLRAEANERKEFEKMLKDLQEKEELLEAQLLATETFITKVLSEKQ